MSKNSFEYRRKSYMEIGEIFFWTATINQWQRLLWPDAYKEVIVNSLAYLSATGKTDVFGFVIMPNHVHFIYAMVRVSRTMRRAERHEKNGIFVFYPLARNRPGISFRE